jgi:hypothetical protein
MATSLPFTRAVIAAAKAALPLPATTMSYSASQPCWAAAREAENGIAPIEPAAATAPTPLALRKPRRETRRRGSEAGAERDIYVTSLSCECLSLPNAAGYRPSSAVADILHQGK